METPPPKGALFLVASEMVSYISPKGRDAAKPQ